MPNLSNYYDQQDRPNYEFYLHYLSDLSHTLSKQCFEGVDSGKGMYVIEKQLPIKIFGRLNG